MSFSAQKLRHAAGIGAEHDFSDGFAREIAVGEDDLVSVAHFIEDHEKLGGDDAGDTFQHEKTPLSSVFMVTNHCTIFSGKKKEGFEMFRDFLRGTRGRRGGFHRKRFFTWNNKR